MLLGFFSLMEPGSVVQLLSAILLCLIFLMLHVYVSPLRSAVDNVLAVIFNLALALIFVFCLALKFVNEGSDHSPANESQRSRSRTQLPRHVL